MADRRILLLCLFCPLLGGCSLFGTSATHYETVVADPHHDVDTARALNASAVSKIEQGKLAEAQALLEKALIADVTYGPAHNNLGEIYYRQGEFYLAAWEFEYASKLMPDRSEPLNNLGLVYEAVNRETEAVPYYESALAGEPGNPQFLSNLARVKIKLGERSGDTARLLKEVEFRDPRAEWRRWAREHLSKSHLNIEPTSPAAYETTSPSSEEFEAPPVTDPGPADEQLNLPELPGVSRIH